MYKWEHLKQHDAPKATTPGVGIESMRYSIRRIAFPPTLRIAVSEWADRNYRGLMLASMAIELILLAWIAFHTH